jgi:integrase
MAMAETGVIFKRCGCRDSDRRRLEQSCPRLLERGHGSWYFHCSATNLLGRRERARLFAFWRLAGLRGLRRGELCGLRWTDIDLDRAILTIERSRTTAGYQIVEGDPKTPAGRRAVALDKRTVQVLRAHRRRQLDQRRDALADGRSWIDSGTCSSAPTGCRSTRTTPPHDSENSSNAPAYRRCGCTTCGTALRRWPTRPAPT